MNNNYRWARIMAAERKLEIRPLLGEEPLAQINLGEARIIQTH